MLRLAPLAWLAALGLALHCDTPPPPPNHGQAFDTPPGTGPVARKEEVEFPSGSWALRGVVYHPRGNGPFPAVLWNHGSWPDPMPAFDRLAPVFAEAGWLFFGPFRRGHGLSASAGPNIQQRLDREGGGAAGRSALAVELLTGPHLDDQLAAYTWLKTRPEVAADQIAVAGNSFGGIEALLGAAHVPYCAAVSGAGASQIWSRAPELRQVLVTAAQRSRAPVLLFQASNDYDLAPTRTLASALQAAGKVAQPVIYPAYGATATEGHRFAWHGAQIWGADILAFLQRHCRQSRSVRP